MVDLGRGIVVGPARSAWSVDGHRIAISARRLQALALSLQHGNAEAGYRMGVAESTVKNLLVKLNNQLGTFSKWEAACALGWTCIPAELLDASPGAHVAGERSVAGPQTGAARRVVPVTPDTKETPP